MIQPHRLRVIPLAAVDNGPVPVDLFPQRPEWHQRAACRGTMVNGKSLWFAHNTEAEKTRQAKLICATCVVRTNCAEAGQNEFGVWGEQTRKQRARGRIDYRWTKRKKDAEARAAGDDSC